MATLSLGASSQVCASSGGNTIVSAALRAAVEAILDQTQLAASLQPDCPFPSKAYNDRRESKRANTEPRRRSPCLGAAGADLLASIVIG